MKHQTNEEVIERVIFLQGESADEALEIYSNEGAEGLLEFLEQWHYPGEHETATDLGHGSSDDVFHFGQYVVSVNTALNYCGLEFRAGMTGKG